MITLRVSLFGIIFVLTACMQPSSETSDTIIDATYPNNWRAPELTHETYKMQVGDISCEEKFPTAKFIDPLPTIIERSKSGRLVMINESHFKPLHRLFIGEIAANISDLGYTHYGAEMLGNVDKTDWLNSDNGPRGKGYITDVEGFKLYWNEPVYAQVIEKISKLNYQFFAYEGDTVHPPEGTQSIDGYREELAAKNIKKRLEKYPNQKFFIHAGYHHIKEINEISYNVWMAERLKTLYPIDPVTISQTECYTDRYNTANLLGYSLLADEDGVPISPDGYDLIIAAPKSPQYRERPLWLRDQMGRRFIEVPETAKFDGPSDFTVITAYRANRPSPAAPEDIIYRPPYSDKVLALRPGDYNLNVTDRDKKLLKTVSIKVKSTNNK